MKIKAIILKPDRTTNVVIMKPKKIQGRVFRHADCMYLLDPDRFMLTWNKRAYGLFGTQYYNTWYFKQGVSNALPAPGFDAMETHTGKNGSKEIDFKNVVDLGVPAEELASIFNPWFYRVISPQSATVLDRLQFWATIAAVAGVIYLIYMLATGTFELPEIPGLPRPAPTPTPAGA